MGVNLVDVHTDTIKSEQYAGSKRYQKLYQKDSPPKNLTIVCSSTYMYVKISILSDSLQRHF